MTDDRDWNPHHELPTPAAKARELLFEFYSEPRKTYYRCDLVDHGAVYGVEAQFFDPIDFSTSRRFDPRLDPSRTPREMAIAWAIEMRTYFEQP